MKKTEQVLFRIQFIQDLSVKYGGAEPTFL
jgi:hypothetical protein